MKFIAVGQAYLVSMLFLTATVFAQDNKVQYDSLTSIIQQAINAGKPETIYGMTSAIFQSKMSAEQFATGMNKFKVKAGEWNSFFYKSHDEKGWNYVAECELSTQLFSLRVDGQGKIERINFAAMPVTVDKKDYAVSGNNPLTDTLDRWIEQLVRPYIQKGNTVGIALAVIDHGRIRRYSYGTTHKNKNTLPDPEKTIFEIGSVTKTFTSLLLAQQVTSGRMRLNDPVNKYLPDSIPLLAFKEAPIQIVHIANHTSGFPRLPSNIFTAHADPKNPYLHYVPDSLYSFLVYYRARVQPGAVFSYSNFGAGLLGTILEKQWKMDFDRMVTQQICKPLGMSNTFVDIPERLKAHFAQGYNENGMATSSWDLASLKGSGAIRSTLNDMIRYTQAQMNCKSLLERSIKLTHITTFQGPGQMMGLGWRIDKAGPYIYFHHSGGTGGFRSFVGFDIDRQLGVVILSNAAEEVTAIGEELLK